MISGLNRAARHEPVSPQRRAAGHGPGIVGGDLALIAGLVNHAFNLALTKYAMAELAYQVEHDDLGRAVGRQDHYWRALVA